MANPEVSKHFIESKELIQFSKLEETIQETKSLSKDFKIQFIFIESWSFFDGDYCQAGDEICKLTAMGNNGVNYHLKISLHQGKGFLTIIKKEGAIYDNENFFKVKQIEDEGGANVILEAEDTFSNIQNITWKRVAANNSADSKLNGFFPTQLNNGYRLFISIHNLEGKDYLMINYPSSDFDIKSGDRIQFLLENKRIVNLSFTQNSYESHKSPLAHLKKIKETKIQLTESDLSMLAEFKIIDSKVLLNIGLEISGLTPDPQFRNACRSREDLSYFLQDMFLKYQEAIKKLPNRKPLNDHPISSIEGSYETDACYVYLMIDTTNSFYKIGISNKPEYREKTLQSEKPTIELIVSKQFPTRIIAESFEKALHTSFKSKNIRGEWFQLSTLEVEQIRLALS